MRESRISRRGTIRGMRVSAFDLPVVHAGLQGTRFAGRVRHFVEISSTSTALLQDAARLPDGTVYVADEQTAGRGRGGHSWHSAPGNGLYMSALVRLPLRLRDALLLSLASGLAAAAAVEQVAGLRIDLRWPNDLMLRGPDGQLRKCGGILVETAVEPGEMARLRYAVIGIGINVNQSAMPPELAAQATSLRLAGGRQIAREPLLGALLRSLDLELHRLEDSASSTAAPEPQIWHDELLRRFEQHSGALRGARVHVAEAGGYTGVTNGLDRHGFLHVIDDTGKDRTVLSGGVRAADDATAPGAQIQANRG